MTMVRHILWRSAAIAFVSAAMLFPGAVAHAGSIAERIAGKILLQVERHGEAWYVEPSTLERYHLGRPKDAFAIMSGFGIGIASAELDAYLAGTFPARLSGRILLDVERSGEAYYVSPDDLRGAYLGRPKDALRIMTDYGLGITDADLAQIPRVLGYSEEGRTIAGYDIGSGGYCVLLIAGIHGGKEPGGKGMMDRFVDDLFSGTETVHPDKRALVIPLANPDGYFGRDDKLNANGVNLNRNFRTSEWVTGDADTTTYAGEAPFTERESRVIRDIAATCADGVMVSFHARGNFVNPENSERSTALARWYAENSGYEYYEGWYYHGTATRWFEETVGGPAITVEMTDYTAHDWEMNRDPLRALVTDTLVF